MQGWIFFFLFCFVLFCQQKHGGNGLYILMIVILNNMYFVHITADGLNVNVIIDGNGMISMLTCAVYDLQLCIK